MPDGTPGVPDDAVEAAALKIAAHYEVGYDGSRECSCNRGVQATFEHIAREALTAAAPLLLAAERERIAREIEALKLGRKYTQPFDHRLIDLTARIARGGDR